MASLFNTRISDTYVSIIKSIDNAVISSTLKQLSDGSGNGLGIYVNTSGDFKVSGILEFGSLKDTAESITITKFVDEADGIANNDNDTTIPTSAAVKDYVDTQITAEDLDFAGDTGSGSVDLDSQVLTISGTTNEIETSASGQTLTIGLPSSISVNLVGNVTGDVTGDLTGNVTATSVLADGVTATTQASNDNSTKVATTAYVDAQVTAEDLDFSGDSGSGSVDLDSQTFSIIGTTNEIETSASNQQLQIGLPTNVTISGETSVGSLKTSGVYYFNGNTISHLSNSNLIFGFKSTTGFRVSFNAGTTDELLIENGSITGEVILDEDNMASDSATKLATQQSIKAYVDSQVGANNELSEVLANGNTTGGTDISVSSGDDITFADSSKAIFGAGSDLQIYHDGSNSYIKDEATGNLLITSDGASVQINKGLTENMAEFITDGAVNLYYDSVKKFQTTSAGISVTGSATVSSDLILSDYGSGTHTGTATQRLGVDSSGNVIEIPIGAGAVDGSGTANTVTMWSDTDTITDAPITISGNNVNLSSGSSLYFGSTSVGITGNASGADYITFRTNANERARLDSSGNLHLGKTTASISTAGITLYPNGVGNFTRDSVIGLFNRLTTDGDVIRILKDDSTVGVIGTQDWIIGSSSLRSDLGSSYTQLQVGGTVSGVIDLDDTTALAMRISVDGNLPTIASRIDGHPLRFSTNSGGTVSERMRITDGGDVGISNTSPSAKLHIGSGSSALISGSADELMVDNAGNSGITIGTGASSVGSLFFADSGSSASGYVQYNHSSNALIMGTEATERMRIDSSGDLTMKGGRIIVRESDDGNDAVKITRDADEGYVQLFSSGSQTVELRGNGDSYFNGGNVGINESNPLQKLHVNSGGGNSPAIFESTDLVSQIWLKDSSSSTTYQTGIACSGDNLIFNNGGEQARIDSSGNVGIGTSNPSYKLDIEQSAENKIRVLATGNTSSGLILQSKAGATVVGTSEIENTNVGNLLFKTGTTSASERARITSGGTLCFGTTDDDVTNNTTTSGTNIFSGGLIAAASASYCLDLNRANASDGEVARFRKQATQVGNISVTGTSTAYNTSSDYRLKEDLKDFNALDIASKIKMYDFKWKADDSRSYGVMAHELEEVLPQAVTGEKDAEEMQSVDYSKLVPILLKSIQELKAEIEELKNNV